MDALIINGQHVDTAKVSIPLDYTTNLFGKPDVIKTNKTYTVKLPRTAHNEKVFGYADTLGITNGIIRKYNSCSYVKEGVEIISRGSAVLLNVTPNAYEICLTWGFDSGVINRIKEIKSLRDLTLPSAIKTTEWTNGDLLTQSPTQGVKVGYAPYNVGVDLDTGRFYDPSTFLNPHPTSANYQPELTYRDLCNLHPFITLEALKDALETTCSFSLKLPTAVENNLRNKCLLLTTDENTLAKNHSLQTDRLYSGIISTRSFIQPPFDLRWAVFQGVVRYKASNGSDTWRVEEPHVKLNGSLKYSSFEHVSGANKSYGIELGEAVDSFDLTINFKTVNDLGTGGIGSTDFYVMKGDPNPWDSIGTVVYTKQYNDNVYNDTINLTSLGLQAGDIIYFSWKYYSSSFTPDLELCEMTASIGNVGYSTPSDASLQIKYPKLYDIESNLPTISGMDFIKLLANLYGLYFSAAAGANELELKSYEELTKGVQPFDLSDRYIGRSSTKFKLFSFAQENLFTFKQDDDKLDTFDGEVVVNDETISAIRNWVNIPFAATNNDLLIHQYDVSRDGYKYSLSKTKKDIRVMGINTNYNGSYYYFNFVPNDLNFDTLKQNYNLYQSAIDDPFVVEVDVRLTTYEVKNFDLDRPVYFSQFGYSFVVLKMRVKKLTTTITLLKI